MSIHVCQICTYISIYTVDYLVPSNRLSFGNGEMTLQMQQAVHDLSLGILAQKKTWPWTMGVCACVWMQAGDVQRYTTLLEEDPKNKSHILVSYTPKKHLSMNHACECVCVCWCVCVSEEKAHILLSAAPKKITKTWTWITRALYEISAPRNPARSKKKYLWIFFCKEIKKPEHGLWAPPGHSTEQSEPRNPVWFKKKIEKNS